MGELIKLPKPRFKSEVPLEETLYLRKSYRSFKDEALTLNEVSQLLWAAYGTNRWGKKVVPSAGATYPLEIYVAVRTDGVKDLNAGVYKYIPEEHALEMIHEGDISNSLCKACLSQSWVRDAPINIIIAAVYERTTMVYGERGIRYVLFEVGHSGQNVSLQAVALGLGTVVVGAFYDDEVAKALHLPKDVKPLYVMPVGKV